MRKMILKLLLAAAALLLLIGCSTDVGWSNESSSVPNFETQEELLAAKGEAATAYENAYNEFFAGMEGESRSGATASQELDPAQAGLREQLVALAFECYNTGDLAKFESFLKANNLYDSFQNVVKKYNIEYHSRVLSIPGEVTGGDDSRKMSNVNFFNGFLDGDILLCYGGGGSLAAFVGFLIPGNPWKHAGILDRTRPWRNDPQWSVLSANPKSTSHGTMKVGYEPSSRWMEEKSVSVWRVRGRNNTNSRNGLDYVKRFLGRNYNVLVSRDSDSSWYCSKVVYRAWLSQGKKLEQKGWFMDFWVTPTDLAEDGDTYWVGGDRR